MTDKDCAPSPEIASKKMLPWDSSANDQASQEDVFRSSIAIEDSGAIKDDLGVEVSGSVGTTTQWTTVSGRKIFTAALSHSWGKTLRGKSGELFAFPNACPAVSIAAQSEV